MMAKSLCVAVAAVSACSIYVHDILELGSCEEQILRCDSQRSNVP
jgi:hypothetical protein